MRWPSVPRTALGASRAAQTREDRRPLALLRRGGSRGRAWVQQALPVGLSATHVQGHGQLRHVRGAPPTAGRWPLSKEGLGERSSPARGDRPQPGGKAVTRTRDGRRPQRYPLARVIGASSRMGCDGSWE